MENKTKGAFIWDLVKFCLIALAIVIPIRLFVAQPFIVSGKSMSPTFEGGNYLIVDELTYHFQKPARGDVIIFHYPNNTKEYFIKRVIALPGETIAITDGKVIIKNTTQPEGFTLSEPYIQGNLTDMVSVTLSDTNYFVMGDNRGASYDSRSWGPLGEKYIVGRAFLRLIPLTSAGVFPGKTTF